MSDHVAIGSNLDVLRDELGSGGGGSTPDLNAVLSEGNDAGGLGIQNIGSALIYNDAEANSPFKVFDASFILGGTNLNGPSVQSTVYSRDGDPKHELWLNGDGWNDPVPAIACQEGVALGFFGEAPVARPEVPATPGPQDVVDALVALGLVTQAAP